MTDNKPVHDELEFGFPEPVEVVFARDSRDAWELLYEAGEPFSVVVVDLQTGAAGGYSLAREMKATLALSDIPIVILLEREQDVWLARQAGAHASLLKPVTGSQVLAASRSRLDR